jgi:hypothetical protein
MEGVRTGQKTTLIDKATGTGNGTAKEYKNVPHTNYTWEVRVVQGTLSALSITLEGSLDGAHFYTLDTSTSTTSAMRHVANKPVKFIRAAIGTFAAQANSPVPKVTVDLLSC